MKLDQKPKLKIEFTTTDTIFELIGWIFLIGIWWYALINYSKLPKIIPIHYDLSGEVNQFGSKTNIITLPFVATFLFIGLTILNKFPHLFNYTTIITEENASKQYKNATKLIRYLKLIIVIIFGSITFKTIQNANEKVNGLDASFLIYTFMSILIPLTYYIVKSYRSK